MTLFQQRYAGTSGTNISTANSSYGLVAPDNVSTWTRSTDLINPITGGVVGKVTAGTGVGAEGRNNTSACDSGSQWLAFRVPAAPTSASLDLLQTRGTVQNSGLRYHTGGGLRVLNLGSEIGGGANYAGFSALAGTDVVIDLVTIQGTTSSNGRIKAQLRSLDDLGTVIWSYDSGTTRNAGVIGTDSITRFAAGKITTGATLAGGVLYLYGHDSNDGATDYLADPDVVDSPPIADYELTRKFIVDFTTSQFSSSLAYTSLVSGDSMGTPSVAGMVATVTDTFGRTGDSVLRFTVTGSGGTDTADVTIPGEEVVAAAEPAIERVYYDGADWV